MATITKIGSVVGTGAAINISVGFIPDYVLIANTTDGTVVDHWWSGMAAGTSIKIDAAAATRAASDGITAYAGSATAGQGFTIGAGISANGKTLRYTAIQSGPGGA
jgi:hypothetical protein